MPAFGKLKEYFAKRREKRRIKRDLKNEGMASWEEDVKAGVDERTQGSVKKEVKTYTDH